MFSQTGGATVSSTQDSTVRRPADLAEIIAEQERIFAERQPRSRETATRAAGSLAGGVTSSWQITAPQPGNALPHLLDDPGTLVPPDDREARREIPLTQMLVRAAQAGRRVPDEHLTGLGGIELQLGDLKVLAHSTQDSGFGLHGSS